MPDPTRPTLDELMQAEAEAISALREASHAARLAEVAVYAEAVRVLKDALAGRGIATGRAVIVEGAYSGGWSDLVRRMKHDRTPVYFRSVAVDSRPPNSTNAKWWFRVQIARMKKDGTPRDEWRHMLIHGATPADAAMMMEPAPDA